jgi:hypothetical protein
MHADTRRTRAHALAATHEALITVEENVVAGDAGSAVNEVLLAAPSIVRAATRGPARPGLYRIGIRVSARRHRCWCPNQTFLSLTRTPLTDRLAAVATSVAINSITTPRSFSRWVAKPLPAIAAPAPEA